MRSEAAWVRLFAVSFCAWAAAACGGDALRPYALAPPIWNDHDRHPFQGPPAEYESPFAWDAADQTLFRPLTRTLAVDPGGEAINVNALDEVPNSSWFQNRIGRFAASPSEVARGPCEGPDATPPVPWTVTGAKPNGANPGFLMKAADGREYLVKFDGVVQGPRATAADVLVSRLYHAAGYDVPCNRVVFFPGSAVKIGQDATAEAGGDEVPLTDQHLQKIFDNAQRTADGRYRASASLLLEGKPIGPWRYQGTRSDDPNDVIPHQDRRELRGMRLLAAWVNHFDSREQNTLAMFVETGGGRGWVRHHLIDFGDSLGSLWEPPMLGRRIGRSHYLDPGDVAEDFVSLGLIERDWDSVQFGKSGPVWGYFNVRAFDPEAWKPGYPNPAFGRMTIHDAAWMARIIARFSDVHVAALVRTGQIGVDHLEHELLRILVGRRDAILRAYLTRLSPLTDPRVSGRRLCLEDRARSAGLERPSRYTARGWLTLGLRPVAVEAKRRQDDRVCVLLPPLEGASAASPKYLILDIAAAGELPARVHLYGLGRDEYRVVGLERPTENEPP